VGEAAGPGAVWRGVDSSSMNSSFVTVIELEALKLFLQFAQRRDQSINLASIGYDKIEEYTGITRIRIRYAISFLVSNWLIHVER
jgi:hypothetical protein